MKTSIVILSSVLLLIPISIIYGQNSEWKIYTDPEDKFSINYPPGWTLEPKQNRFDYKDFDVEITIL